MVFLQSEPHPALQPYIHQYWYMASDDPSEFGQPKQTMFPMDFPGLSFYFLKQPVIEHFKKGIRRTLSALYTGLITSPGSITFEPNEPIEGFVVAFLPHGFADLFNYDVSTTTDRLPDFFTMYGTEGRAFYNQLAAANDFESKTDIANNYFLPKLPKVGKASQMIAAVNKIVESNGLIDMNQLACEVNMSWKTLERHFKKRVGVSPKMYARFKRFHHALELLNTPASGSWTEIAHACGYYDQAHFIKEFMQFTNSLPSAFSVQDYPLFYRFIIAKK